MIATFWPSNTQTRRQLLFGSHILDSETTNNLFAFAVCLLEVTSFLVSANCQTLPAQLGIKQLTLHDKRISLAAKILDVCARHVKILCRLTVVFHFLF